MLERPHPSLTRARPRRRRSLSVNQWCENAGVLVRPRKTAPAQCQFPTGGCRHRHAVQRPIARVSGAGRFLSGHQVLLGITLASMKRLADSQQNRERSLEGARRLASRRLRSQRSPTTQPIDEPLCLAMRRLAPPQRTFSVDLTHAERAGWMRRPVPKRSQDQLATKAEEIELEAALRYLRDTGHPARLSCMLSARHEGA